MSCQRAQQIDLAAFRAEPAAAEWAEFRAHYPTCAECSREVAAWSRIVAALEDSGARAAHPSEERLLAFESDPGELAASERAAIESHVSGCAPCRNELAVLRGFDFDALAAPSARSVATPSLAERVRGWLTGLAETVFGVPQPALAVMLLLAIPAAIFSWRVLQDAEPRRPEAPIARVERPVAPVPEPVPEIPAPEPEPQGEVIAEQTPEAPSAEVIAEQTPTPPLSPEPTPVPDTEPAPQTEPSQLAVEEPPAPAEPALPDEPILIAALLPGDLPAYRPDLALAGGSFEDVRITSVVRAGGPELPRLRTLGPKHVGATAEASPVLYWDLAAQSDVPVEITVVAEDGVEPLVELRLTPPVRAGVHRLALRDHGVSLAPGKPYLWFVAFVPDEERREEDVVSGAGILRTPASDALMRALQAAGPAGRAHALAEAGYWYDAFATVSEWILAEPEEERLRAVRAALLDQAGL